MLLQLVLGALQDFDKSGGSGDKGDKDKSKATDAAAEEGGDGSEDPDAFFM